MRGFTLIEMITVLTIIILVLAIAIPVWNALMGGTNVAAAQNQVSAFLANARADAIYNRKTIGVCFFIDAKSQRTAMAEVQVQSEWFTGTPTPLFVPNVGAGVNNGSVNAIELVNSPDPNSSTNPPNYIFPRDIVLLPVGVGVALNNNTYTYNQAFLPNGSTYLSYRSSPKGLPPIDRYLRLGVIMFDANGALTTIPFGIPLDDKLSAITPAPQGTENLLCQRIGMAYVPGSTSDIASNVNVVSPGTPSQIPLMSSVGLVIYDHDAYLAQHASMTVKSAGTPTNIGSGAPFNDFDMNYYLYTNPNSPTTASYQTRFDDKFIEENWIDQNGTALMINPSNGSLIRAK
jgi:prepilin-type N-terminal cleavage/methylation domain-containing protein